VSPQTVEDLDATHIELIESSVELPEPRAWQTARRA
jgi:hypothetical protein